MLLVPTFFLGLDDPIASGIGLLGGLILIDAKLWYVAAYTAEDLYPGSDAWEVHSEAYRLTSLLKRWGLLAATALTIALLRGFHANGAAWLLSVLPFGAYAIFALFNFKSDIRDYAEITGLKGFPRLEAGEARFDTRNPEER